MPTFKIQRRIGGKNIRVYLFGAAIYCALGFTSVQALKAQEGRQTAETPKAISLTPEQLKAFEGFFQSQQNKDLNIQITVGAGALDAKLLWNGGQLHALPQSDSVFFSKEEERVTTIRFFKGADGTFAQMSIGNKVIWNRVKDYKPLVRIEAPHTPDQLKPYEGLYENERNKDRYLQFTEKENNLVMRQHWDGQELPFVPDSAWSFFNKKQLLLTLVFTKEPDGQITKVLAFKKEMWNKVKKVHYSHEEMKAFEGRYQLKVDNDDLVQITASGDSLVIKQLWDGKETTVSPMADLYFYNTALAYPIKFIKNSDGTVTQATALNGDEFEKVK